VTNYLASGNIFFQSMFLSHNLVFALACGGILLAVAGLDLIILLLVVIVVASVLYSVGYIVIQPERCMKWLNKISTMF